MRYNASVQGPSDIWPTDTWHSSGCFLSSPGLTHLTISVCVQKSELAVGPVLATLRKWLAMCPTQGTVCQSMTACNQLTISGPKRDRSIHIQQAHCWKWLCSRLTGALHRTYFTVSKVAAEQTLCFQDAPQSICERDKEHMPLYICICTSKYCKIGPIKRCKL